VHRNGRSRAQIRGGVIWGPENLLALRILATSGAPPGQPGVALARPPLRLGTSDHFVEDAVVRALPRQVPASDAPERAKGCPGEVAVVHTSPPLVADVCLQPRESNRVDLIGPLLNADEPVVAVMGCGLASILVAGLVDRLAAERPVVRDEADRGVQQCPLLASQWPERREHELEGVSCADLVLLYMSLSVEDIEAELPRPARTAEQLADDAPASLTVRASRTRVRWVARAPTESSHEDLKPPANRPEQAGGDEAAWVAVAVAGPDGRQRLHAPGLRLRGHQFNPSALKAAWRTSP